MAEPVRARRLTDEEGRRRQQIVRRGKHGSIWVRRCDDDHGVVVGNSGAGDRPADRGG